MTKTEGAGITTIRDGLRCFAVTGVFMSCLFVCQWTQQFYSVGTSHRPLISGNIFFCCLLVNIVKIDYRESKLAAVAFAFLWNNSTARATCFSMCQTSSSQCFFCRITVAASWAFVQDGCGLFQNIQTSLVSSLPEWLWMQSDFVPAVTLCCGETQTFQQYSKCLFCFATKK